MTNAFKYFDAHCHIQGEEYDGDRAEVIARMVGDQVGGIVVGTDKETSEQSIALAEQQPFLFSAVGVHPTDTIVKTFDIETFTRMAQHPKVVAIGECGLDYYRANADTAFEKTRQRDLFEGHIECAVNTGKPLMIHCRAAHEDMLEIVKSKKRSYGERLKGNIHFFTAPLEIAHAYFGLGFSVSFSGVITFAHEYDDVIREAPEELILSETDSPYASPPPYRGSRNEPTRVIEVIKRIAQVRETPFDQMASILLKNAERIFNLPKA